MHFLEHVEASILIIVPIIGILAVALDFSWTNVLLLGILLLVWKHANGAL